MSDKGLVRLAMLFIVVLGCYVLIKDISTPVCKESRVREGRLLELTPGVDYPAEVRDMGSSLYVPSPEGGGLYFVPNSRVFVFSEVFIRVYPYHVDMCITLVPLKIALPFVFVSLALGGSLFGWLLFT